MSKRRIYITVLVIFILAFLAGNLDYPQLLHLPYLPNIPFKLGLDLQGGTHLVYQADLSSINEEDQGASMQGLRDVIERRVNYFGVSEPLVQVQDNAGSHRLIVELAGVTDSAQAIKMIGQTPFLEFREQKADYDEIVKKNQELINSGQEDVALEDPFQPTLLTGKYLEKAEPDFDETTYQPLVSIQFNSEGADIFSELTARNIGKPLAIYIDGLPISAPIVQEKISQGKAQISGSFTIEETKTLSRNLNAGALPVPITLISQQNVGPTLGKISLEESLKAGAVGFLLILLFMIVFYRVPGLLASLSLLIYVALVLALFKFMSVTLTLAGIAGFILSMGMAVDANVLIFSRFREEFRTGKSYLASLEEGVKRAWPAIRDGNLTTILVGLILFGFGSSFVKGFAFTLILGNLVGMFTAIIITNYFLKCFINTRLERVKFLWQ